MNTNQSILENYKEKSVKKIQCLEEIEQDFMQQEEIRKNEIRNILGEIEAHQP